MARVSLVSLAYGEIAYRAFADIRTRSLLKERMHNEPAKVLTRWEDLEPHIREAWAAAALAVRQAREDLRELEEG
jgi:hypothetical protein